MFALTEAVPAVIFAASELEAFKMLVLAVAIDEPSEDEALSTFVLVVVTLVPIVARVEPKLEDDVFVLLLIEVTAPET